MIIICMNELILNICIFPIQFISKSVCLSFGILKYKMENVAFITVVKKANNVFIVLKYFRVVETNR